MDRGRGHSGQPRRAGRDDRTRGRHALSNLVALLGKVGDDLLATGLSAIRDRFAVPSGFPPEVVAEAERMHARALTDHVDWTDRAFVTLDPATSTDLDQAFLIDEAGPDLILHYALSDIAWFVPRGGAMEAEAWTRGVTLYLPDARARLYPPILSEGAASLLPDGPRPAIVTSVRCSKDGSVVLDGVTRAVIRSRAKLAYETVDIGEVPYLGEFARRMQRGEDARGAARVDLPEQEVERMGEGGYHLAFRPWLPSEVANSALSLAANVAIADALLAAKTGLFREMPPPDDRAIARLRRSAEALGLSWPANATLAQFERIIDPATPAGAAFQFAVRRATGGARYVPFREGEVPWHAALGATYTHATAPMRRLADRYVLDALLSLARGNAPGPEDAELFARLAPAMDTADAREGAIERAVTDLAEAIVLHGREGERFDAIVTERDERGARIQLADLPIIGRVDAHRIASGEAIRVALVSADIKRGEVRFERVN